MKKFNELDYAMIYLAQHNSNLNDHDHYLERSLVITIRTKQNYKNTSLERNIYNKLHKVFTGGRYDPKKPAASMIICKDVEGTRDGYCNARTLKNPSEPHYHALMTFQKDQWAEIEPNLEYLIKKAQQELYDFDEIFSPFMSQRKKIIRESVFIQKFDPEKSKNKTYYCSGLRYVQYVIKANLLADKGQVDDFHVSVFPASLEEHPIDEVLVRSIFNDIKSHQEQHQEDLRFSLAS